MHHTYIELSGDVELNPIPTCLHHGYMHHVYMHHVYTHHVYMHHGYMHHIMDTCIMDTSAWVIWPERPKGVKDEI